MLSSVMLLLESVVEAITISVLRIFFTLVRIMYEMNISATYIVIIVTGHNCFRLFQVIICFKLLFLECFTQIQAGDSARCDKNR